MTPTEYLRYLSGRLHLLTRVHNSDLPKPMKKAVVCLLLRRLLAKTGKGGGVWKFAGHDLYFANEGLMQFVFEEIFTGFDYFVQLNTAKPRILDCGGNIGTSVIFFKMLYPGAVIDVFEPAPDSLELLNKNITSYGFQDVTVHAVAVGENDSEIDFFVDDERPSSLEASACEERTNVRKIAVPVKRLSQFIDGRVDLLKIDIEGSEWGVMQDLEASGAFKVIESIVVEYHHHLSPGDDRLAAFLGYFERNGFTYQLSANPRRPYQSANFQDIIIHAVKCP